MFGKKKQSDIVDKLEDRLFLIESKLNELLLQIVELSSGNCIDHSDHIYKNNTNDILNDIKDIKDMMSQYEKRYTEAFVDFNTREGMIKKCIKDELINFENKIELDIQKLNTYVQKYVQISSEEPQKYMNTFMMKQNEVYDNLNLHLKENLDNYLDNYLKKYVESTYVSIIKENNEMMQMQMRETIRQYLDVYWGSQKQELISGHLKVQKIIQEYMSVLKNDNKQILSNMGIVRAQLETMSKNSNNNDRMIEELDYIKGDMVILKEHVNENNEKTSNVMTSVLRFQEQLSELNTNINQKDFNLRNDLNLFLTSIKDDIIKKLSIRINQIETSLNNINSINDKDNNLLENMSRNIQNIFYENEIIKHQFMLEEEIRSYYDIIDHLQITIKRLDKEIATILEQ